MCCSFVSSRFLGCLQLCDAGHRPWLRSPWPRTWLAACNTAVSSNAFRAELHAFAGVLRVVVSADSNEIQSGIKRRTWHSTLRTENGLSGCAWRPLHKLAATLAKYRGESQMSAIIVFHAWVSSHLRQKQFGDHLSPPSDHQAAAHKSAGPPAAGQI